MIHRPPRRAGFNPERQIGMWFAYALRSSKDGGLYVGMTSDVERRVREHNSGYSQDTKLRAPFSLIYFEECASRSNAREREKFLKSGKGRDFLNSGLENAKRS